VWTRGSRARGGAAPGRAGAVSLSNVYTSSLYEQLIARSANPWKNGIWCTHTDTETQLPPQHTLKSRRVDERLRAATCLEGLM
jgi:hypothetical protein